MIHTPPRSYRDSEAYQRSDRADAQDRKIWPLAFADRPRPVERERAA